MNKLKVNCYITLSLSVISTIVIISVVAQEESPRLKQDALFDEA